MRFKVCDVIHAMKIKIDSTGKVNKMLCILTIIGRGYSILILSEWGQGLLAA